MNKLVILNSFHSQSMDYLVDHSPEEIITFDSHLDDYMMMCGAKTVKIINRLSIDDRCAILRTSVHFLLKTYFPDTPRYLVIPESSYLFDINYRSKGICGYIDPTGVAKELRRKKEHIFANIFETKIFLSPPRNIKQLLKKVAKHKTAFDIDVDYLAEFQNVCFTRCFPLQVEGFDLTTLGSINTLKYSINRIKPKIIIISEFMPSYLKNNVGVLKEFLEWLKRRGYTIEDGKLFETDEDALRVKEKSVIFFGRVLRKKQEKLTQNCDNLDEIMASALESYYLQK